MANDNNNGSGKMTVEEAGRMGGEEVNKDRERMREIGQKGGQATAQSHDSSFYKEIGHEGGEARSNNNNESNNNSSNNNGQ